MKRVTVVLLTIALTACGGMLPLGPRSANPAATPPKLDAIGKTAVYGRQVVIAGQGVLRGLDGVMSAGVLSREYGVPVIQVMRLIGQESVRLADVLLALEAAHSQADKATLVGKAKLILAGMESMVSSSTIPIPDERAKAIVTGILSTFSGILQNFGNEIDMLINLIGSGRLTAEARELRLATQTWAQEASTW